MNWDTIIPRKIFISAMVNLYPKQEWGPNPNVIMLPRPGWAGERALAGKLVQRSGLEGDHQHEEFSRINRAENLLELSRVASPDVFGQVQTLDGDVDVAALANANVSILFEGGAVLESDGAGNGDLVVTGRDANGAVDRGTDSEGFAHDGI
jgi:hypothetical protein